MTVNKDQKKWLQDFYPLEYKIGYADFVTGWFIKAANYMQRNQNIKTAFVSTNSICQGEQVNTLWGLLLGRGIKINFAYTSFPWFNGASNKAGVTCIIVGFSYKESKKTWIEFFDNKNKSSHRLLCNKISPYLTNNSQSIIVSRQKMHYLQI